MSAGRVGIADGLTMPPKNWTAGSLVDGGGVKGSMTDPNKVPLSLVPLRFYRFLLMGAPKNPELPAELMLEWVNRQNPLVAVLAALVGLYGGEQEVLRQTAAVLAYGANKYSAHNWRRGMKWSECASAALRHLTLQDPQSLDPESGLPHWAHAACSIAFLMEYEAHPELYAKFDDRHVAYQPQVAETTPQNDVFLKTLDLK